MSDSASPTFTTEINGDDAAWLRGQTLPDGCDTVELDEVEFFGRAYDRAPGSALYVPTDATPVDRAIARYAEQATPTPAPIGIDLFSGCGGFSLGMHEAGIDVVAAVEWDAPAAQTYLCNLARPDCELLFATEADRVRYEKSVRVAKKRAPSDGRNLDSTWYGSGYRASRSMPGGCRAFAFGDIRGITGQQLMNAADVDSVDVVFGGPPCQGLSTANSKACLEDPRNAMIWEYLRIVREVEPKFFVIENVPAILTVAKGALFNAISRIGNEMGYNVVAQKIDAVARGVPQHRLRAIIVGSRQDVGVYRYPMPSTWALGRLVDGDNWQMRGRGDEDGNIPDPSLPAEAEYDPVTRKWSVGAEPAPTITPFAQSDLFGGAA